MNLPYPPAVDIPRKRIGNARRAILPIAIVAALFGVYATVWRSSGSAAAAVERTSVLTARVRRGELVRQVPVQGTLVPEHVQWLSAVSAARVAHINVRPGATVEAETVVVTLENADLELAALEAQSKAANAESLMIQLDVQTSAAKNQQESILAGVRAESREAERHAKAALRLAPEGLVSDLERRDAEGRLQGTLERVDAEQARRNGLASGHQRQLVAQRAEVARLREIASFRRRQLAALEVRAGISGVVQDIPLENGQWVAIGTVLAKVAEPSRLKAEVKVAEGNAREVHKGLVVRFAGPSGAFRGHVERVDPAVVAGSVRLEVTLDDALPKGARADQTVTGYVEIDKISDAVFVERPAGVQEGASAGVFRLGPDGSHAERVNARFGRGSTREIEVVGDLAEGDTIIVSDTSAWDTSSRIRLK